MPKKKQLPQIPVSKRTQEAFQKRLEQLKKGGKASGMGELRKYYSGVQLTAMQSIKAHCYECCGYYDQGVFDCSTFTCPLYPFNPAGQIQKATKKPRKRKEKA